MVGPGVYASRMKAKQMSHSLDNTPNSSNAEEEKTVPSTDHLPTNLTLKFHTNVRLQRNAVLATVTIVNAFVTAALIAAAVPTGAYIQNELNSSRHKIVALQEQVKFLTDRYEYILKQLSMQHTSTSQYKDVDSINSGGPSQHIETREPSVLMKGAVYEEELSKGVRVPKQIISPELFPEGPHTSREVPVESDGSQYATVTLRRTKRSDWRGKQSQRKPSNGGRGRQRRRGKFSGAAVAHFKGGQPETFIRDGGLVAPWFLDDAASGRFGLSSLQLKQGKAAVEVTESGLYYIYCQIHYLTSQVTNSYSLNLRHGSQSNSSVLSYCSASSGSQTLNEVSCFTSVVRYLNSTDRVFIQQRDMNRRIILRDGYSFLGVVRLST